MTFFIGRRQFISLLGGAVSALPVAARAQQGERIRRVGALIGLPENDPETRSWLADFEKTLERLGWLPGRDVRIEYRYSPAATRVQELAKEVVATQPDVILSYSTPASAALQRESSTVPIVFVGVADPIGSGLIASLARPGGNLTGLMMYDANVAGKWIAMLKEIAPALKRTGLVINPRSAPYYQYFLRAAEAAAPSLGVGTAFCPIENDAADVERVVESFARLPDGGLVVLPDSTTQIHRASIIALAARYRLPAVYSQRVQVTDGGLMSYGLSWHNELRNAATYVDRILRGAKPADLPVQAPTKYELVINLKTAKALGLDVPATVLARADEVIE
jgi:putative ABC transport system substrate-binding protein